MSFLTLQPMEGGVFKSVPQQIGFTEAEGSYYIKRHNTEGLAGDELERVRMALERGAYRLAHVECQGVA